MTALSLAPSRRVLQAGTAAGPADDETIAQSWGVRNASRVLLMFAATTWAAVVQLRGSDPRWMTGLALGLGVLTSVYGAAVRFLPRLTGNWVASFAVLLVLTIGLEAWAGPPWAVNVGWVAGAAAWGPSAKTRAFIPVSGLAAGVLAWARGASTGSALLLAGFVLLTGIFSVQARRGSELIEELRRTRDELARLAIVDERNRIARDLHDLVGHSLSVIAVKTELTRRVLVRDADRAAGELRDIEDIVRRALAEVRQAVTNYRQPTLAAELSSATEAARAAGIACTVHAPESWDLPVPVEALLAWTVREGITNVLRHSGASRCVITVALDGERVAAEVADDGGGPRDAGGTPGHGLIGLSERARALGGGLTVGVHAEGGFRLRVEVPGEGR